MKKKILIVLLLIVLIGFGMFIWLNKEQKGSSSTKLSERSKEFLEKKRSQGSIDYAGIGDDKKSGSSSSKVTVGSCFSMEVPFEITDTKHLGDCFDQITIGSPRGIINVYTRVVSFGILDDDPGVKLRRADPKTYKEEKKTVNGYNFLIFKKTDAGYEKTALYLENGRIFSLNLLSNISDPGFDSKFGQMLESVEFL